MRILSLLVLFESLRIGFAQHQSVARSNVTSKTDGNQYNEQHNHSLSIDTECYEMPLILVSAVDRSFPDATCNQLRYPAMECLKEPVQTRVEVVDTQDGSLNCIHGQRTAVFEHSESSYRGQSSLFFAKHQFNVKFPVATSFLGMVKNKIFIMNGPFLDCTLQRNHLAHWLYRLTGRYAVKTRHAVVYLRTDPAQEHPRYAGIYLLLEKITYDKNHVNLASIDAFCAACDPNVMNGGWAWSNDPLSYGSYSPNMVIDQYQNEFGMGERPLLAYPSGPELSQQMRDYFVSTNTGFLPQMYRVLWYNMTASLELQKHLDLGSFADYLLHTEMSLNTDAYRRSTFFFKDRDQPINAGPVWDFNLAYGNGARRNFKDWIFPQYTFWKRLMCHSQLASLVIQRWKTLRGINMSKMNDSVFGVWSDEAVAKFLDASAAPVHRQLRKCYNSDWRSDAVQCASVDLQTCNGSYAEKITDLRDSVLNRARWMDQKIEQLYKPLDAETCSGVGEISKYNCGHDGSDDGCLSNAEKYYNAVVFPPVRKPYTGPSCEDIVVRKTNSSEREESAAKTDSYQKASIDYCWMSAGTYLYPQQKGVKEKLTPFCNGYGLCEQGAGATCNCSSGIEVEHPSCRRIDAENEHYMRKQQLGTTAATIHSAAIIVAEAQTASSTKSIHNEDISKPLPDGMVVIAVAAAGVVLMILGMWLVNEKKCRHRRHRSIGTYKPIYYGSAEYVATFAPQQKV